jgi:predicted AlkP superfamily pyrophosphatase or phosphodiesterase
MSKRHVVVVSVDALVYEDLETLSKLYALAPRWDKMARVDRVRSIYPTITYPCHSTMMTGVYPDRHHIVNNEAPILGVEHCLWQHFRSSVKAPSIFDAAKKAGLTTAAVFWPVTGKDPAIDYLVDEYWPQHGEDSVTAFRDSGSSEEVIKKIVKPNLKYLEGKHRMHPYADAFVMGCAADMLRNFQPDLLMVHPANVDSARHASGLFTPAVTNALYDTNLWLEELFKAAEDAGIYEDTNFFIVSDHGQIEIRRSVALNALLAEEGLLDVAPDGTLKDWTAFAKSGGTSALVYLKDPADQVAWNKTKIALEKLRDSEVCGIGEILTEAEARERYHLGGDFAFVIETDGWTSFSTSWLKPVQKPLDNSDYRFGRATHGHEPEKGPQPTLMAFGPDIQPGAHLDTARLVDEAPTFAHALGLTMPDTDGHCLTELFR